MTIRVIPQGHLTCGQAPRGTRWQFRLMRLALRALGRLACFCHCELIYLDHTEQK